MESTKYYYPIALSSEEIELIIVSLCTRKCEYCVQKREEEPYQKLIDRFENLIKEDDEE